MKIIYNESTYLIPEKNIINVVSGRTQKQLVDCLDMYFNKKKKNYCRIYDSLDSEISNQDISFVYIPYGNEIEQNFLLKPKSYLNNEISHFIEENPLDFLSFENIRNNLKECVSDRGMFTLKNILKQEIDSDFEISLNDFNIHNLLSMLKIDMSQLSLSDCYKILYNLILFENKNKFSIVYIDFPIYEKDLKWLKSHMKDNLLFLIDNDIIHCDISTEIKNFSMIILSDQDYIETQEYDIREFNTISYLQNDFILQHLDMQTEKNIRLIKDFNDKNTTFYLLFSDNNTLKPL